MIGVVKLSMFSVFNCNGGDLRSDDAELKKKTEWCTLGGNVTIRGYRNENFAACSVTDRYRNFNLPKHLRTTGEFVEGRAGQCRHSHRFGNDSTPEHCRKVKPVHLQSLHSFLNSSLILLTSCKFIIIKRKLLIYFLLWCTKFKSETFSSSTTFWSFSVAVQLSRREEKKIKNQH